MTELFESPYIAGIATGVVFGILARLSMLRTDYRQYPTYPHGRIIHLALGLIAASLGSLAVPSLLEKQYTAVTFLTLAAQQFRDVRNMERQTLTNIDSMELVPRGATYIEGIAMVFEGRNYMVMFTALVSSMCGILFGWYWGAAAGILALLVSNYYKTGKSLSSIAQVEPAPVRIDGPDLYVGDIYIMNVGLDETRKLIREHGIGCILTPKDKNSRITLSSIGQRQALLHDACTIMGVYRDTGEPSLLPMAKLDMNDGRLAVLLLPPQPDQGLALSVVKRVPLLESAVRLPVEAHVHSGEQL